jgi:hypothetical protein
MAEPSILDARLAEIDRRLRMIQSGLEPVRSDAEDPTPQTAEPTPLIARRVAAPAPVPADHRDEEIAVLTARLSELTATHERLVASTRDLLVEQTDMLARVTPVVSLSAGPFADSLALREFQQALSGLPKVSEVTVREYVGSESVVLDVHLRSDIS